jgi:hypothetical protein
VLTFGEFRRTLAGQTQSVSNLVIDYLQRFDTLRYDYLLQGTLGSQGNSGEFRVNTPLSLTGTIGSYPSAGRLSLNGAAKSTGSQLTNRSAGGAAALRAGVSACTWTLGTSPFALYTHMSSGGSSWSYRTQRRALMGLAAGDAYHRFPVQSPMEATS